MNADTQSLLTIGRAPPPVSLGSDKHKIATTRLVRAVQELSLARDLATIQKIVRTAAREITGCDGATFVLRDNGHCFYADEDAIAPLWKGKRFPMEICISGWAMLNRKSAVIPDIYADRRIPHEAYRPTFVKSLVMVPIRSIDPVGAIGNYWAEPHAPLDEEIELLQTLADSTAIAIENVQLYDELERRVQDRTSKLQNAKEEIERLSLTDELTGINNRRGFYLLATQALSGCERRKNPCALAFVDVDGLKKVNDEQGHDAGDMLISDMAGILRKCCREADIIGRFGGDEFCVLLLDAEEEGRSLPTRLQAAIDAFNIEGGRPYKLSASIGVTYSGHDIVASLDSMIVRADELMYAQKRTKSPSRTEATLQ